LKIGTTTLSSGGSGTFVGNVTGNVTGNITGNITGNVTGNVNSTGISTLTTIRGSDSIITVPTGHKIVGVDAGSVRAPGTVIQFGFSRYDPNGDIYTTVAIDTELVSDVSLTFTPKFASSKLFVISRYHARMIDANGVTFGIKRDGSYVDGMYQRNSLDFFFKGDSVNHHYTGKCEAYLDANSTSATTFTIWASGWSGGTWERSYAFGEHSIAVMEIAQ
jgi:hypothetical protein